MRLEEEGGIELRNGDDGGARAERHVHDDGEAVDVVER